jgi:hypothetical protein
MFIVMGVRWLIAPDGIAPEFGLILGDGLGLSSQIGDMSGYFLFLGISILLGVVTGHRPWFYAAAILLSLTAVGRTVAWLIHDAALASHIRSEVVIATLLIIASWVLGEDD